MRVIEADELNHDEVIDCIKSGLTPQAIQMAYKTITVRKLATETGHKMWVVGLLADRWGINKGKCQNYEH